MVKKDLRSGWGFAEVAMLMARGHRPGNPILVPGWLVQLPVVKKKIDPCRTGPRDLKFGTSEHNIVFTDDP